MIKKLKNRISQFLDPSIIKGAGITFIIKVLGSIASFGLQLTLARLLNIDDYGSYVYIMAWIGMISGFTSLGFTTSLIRYIPEYLRNGEFQKLRGVILTSIWITLGCSVVFSIVGVLVMTVISDSSNKDGFSFISYLLSGGILIGLAFTSLLGNLEKGKKNMFMAHAPSQLFKHLLIGGGVFLFWYWNNQIDVQIALWVTFIAIFLLDIWYLISLRKGLPKEVFGRKPLFRVKEWMKVSLPLMLISGFLMILNRLDVIMLGVLSTKAEVGIYNVAYKITTIVTFILMAVNAIVAPTISELFHQNKTEELQRLATNTIHIIFWPTLLVSLLLVLSSDFILGLFGSEFLAGRTLLYILLISQLFAASTGCVGNFLNMTGYQNESAKIYGITALVNVIFNPIGIYFYGAVGAAVVTTISVSIYNFWFYFIVRNKIGVKTSIYDAIVKLL